MLAGLPTEGIGFDWKLPLAVGAEDVAAPNPVLPPKLLDAAGVPPNPPPPKPLGVGEPKLPELLKPPDCAWPNAGAPP